MVPMRSWWRRLNPQPPPAEQIMEQMLADSKRAQEQPVAYHQEQARFWKRHARSFLAMLAFLVVVALLVDNRWTTVFYLPLAFWQGTRWHFAHTRYLREAQQAWVEENETTVNAMLAGGMLTNPRQVLEVMREADPPPGTSKKDWVEQHDRLIREWDEEHGASD